jgi:ATP-dependent exoDNAse (exonuclease V) alpha subunit
MNLNLTQDQLNIFNSITKNVLKDISRRNVFTKLYSITGPAGSGKSFLIQSIVEHILGKRKSIAVLTPTHKALKVVKGYVGLGDKITYNTVHAYYGLKPQTNFKTGEITYVADKWNPSGEPVDFIVIDESSFISADLFNKILSQDKAPVILFVGDELQLLPVESSKSKEKECPIFSAKLIKKYSLTEILRNDDHEVQDFCDIIRHMIKDGKSKRDLQKFLNKERTVKHNKIIFFDNRNEFVTKFISKDRHKCEADCIVTFTNDVSYRYNVVVRNFYTQQRNGRVDELTVDDLFVVQESTRDFINSETIELRTFKKKTFHAEGITLNGYVCYVYGMPERTFNYLSETSRDEYNEKLKVLQETAKRKQTPEDWEKYYKFKSLFLDVRYVYSCTCHKAQGSSYENIYVDLQNIDYVESDMFLRLFYVAITRSRGEINLLI